MTTIIYGTTPTTWTVQATMTQFVNNTGDTITLQSATKSVDIADNTTSDKLSMTVVNLKQRAQTYYSTQGNSYTILGGKTVTLTKSGASIQMGIP